MEIETDGLLSITTMVDETRLLVLLGSPACQCLEDHWAAWSDGIYGAPPVLPVFRARGYQDRMDWVTRSTHLSFTQARTFRCSARGDITAVAV